MPKAFALQVKEGEVRIVSICIRADYIESNCKSIRQDGVEYYVIVGNRIALY